MNQGQPQQLSLNIDNYKQWKAKGLVSLQSAGKGMVFLVKDRFDSETGDPVDPGYVPLTQATIDNLKKQVNLRVEEANKAVNAVNDLQADFTEALTQT